MSKQEILLQDFILTFLPSVIQMQWAYLPVWRAWEGIVGPETALHVWPHHIDSNGVLFLMVSDSIWMQQLSFQRHVLINELNLRLKHRKLRDIRMFLGDVSRLCGVFKKLQKNAGYKGQGVKKDVTEELKRTADAMVESIKDEELRGLAKQLYLISELISEPVIHGV